MERATLTPAIGGSLTAQNVVTHLWTARHYAFEAAKFADAGRERAELDRRGDVKSAWSEVHRECIAALCDLDDAIEACER